MYGSCYLSCNYIYGVGVGVGKMEMEMEMEGGVQNGSHIYICNESCY